MKFSTKKLPNSLKLLGLSVGAGLVMAIPFLWYRLGWLVVVALLPFFYLLKILAKHKLNRRSVVGYVWVSGWIALLLVLGWMLQTQPERWSAAQGWLATGGLIFAYMAMSLCLSVGFVIFALLYSWLRVRLDQKRVFLLLPAIWVVGEWLRSWLFSLISIGPNTSLGPHWNFATLGFALSPTPLVFSSRLVGLYGLSFIVVAINLAILWLVQKRWKLPLVVFGIIAAIALLGYITYSRPDGRTVNVAVLQLGINGDLQIGSIDYHNKLKSAVSPGTVDVLVMPEYSNVFQPDEIKSVDQDAMETISRNNDTPVITSRQRSEGAKLYNTVTVYRPDASIAYEHDKQFLIPAGEAMPYIFMAAFKLFGQSSAVDTNNASREVSKGPEMARAYQMNSQTIGSMACSGAISPELYRALVQDGAGLLTNSASLSIFEKAPTYHQQAEQMARFISVANARPYAQATDGSISYILDSNGKWLARSSQNKIEMLQHNVVTNKAKTIYTLLGEWVILASLGIVVTQIVVLMKSQKHN